jgi:cobalt/nickel transport system permease protein
MHIPDGLMDPLILLIGWGIAVSIVALATRIVNKKIENKYIPLMAVLGAGIFVAQMLNFPVGGGTTGHLIGAALAAILLGPLSSIIIITTILILQCLLFGDGGLTALGLNILNMAVIGSLTGYFTYAIFNRRYQKIAIFIASWLSVLLGALMCSIELSLSYIQSNGIYGISPYISIPSMLGYHIIIGIGEGIITTGILVYVKNVSPEMLHMHKITFKQKQEVFTDA